MSGWRRLYTVLLWMVMPLALLRLLWRSRKLPAYRQHLAERFGRFTEAPQAPLIWLHAVSVGETRAAEPLVRALQQAYPQHRILLTHTTPTGRAAGEQLFGQQVQRAYLPYDLPFAVAAFLAHFQPRLGVLLETELWPNLVQACARARVPLYLVNARLSELSARGYARVRSLTRETLHGLAGIAGQSQADGERLKLLGGERVTVTGNLKFDRAPSTLDLELSRRLRAQFGMQRRIFLAASTREGEEQMVLDAVAAVRIDGLLTVLVPRHPQRFDTVADLLKSREIDFQRRSADQAIAASTAVVLGDSMGELFAYYGACDVALVGGSLQALGGQNLLEACAAGKPVVVGPHTFNFEEATRLAVAAGAAIRVEDAGQLAVVLTRLLQDRAEAQSMGQAGLALMHEHQGATQRILALLKFD